MNCVSKKWVKHNGFVSAMPTQTDMDQWLNMFHTNHIYVLQTHIWLLVGCVSVCNLHFQLYSTLHLLSCFFFFFHVCFTIKLCMFCAILAVLVVIIWSSGSSYSEGKCYEFGVFETSMFQIIELYLHFSWEIIWNLFRS